MNKNSVKKAIDFDIYLNEQLKNPKFKKYYDEYGRQLEIAYRILELRKSKGLSQKDLAEKVGTKQSNIARIESGKQNFSIGTLERIAKVLGCGLKISLD
jgi:ribosome-binding protein aMBF1 (putative translation factor)